MSFIKVLGAYGGKFINKSLTSFLISKNLAIKTLIIEISFPSKFDKLAKDSKHLTPQILKDELEKIMNKR